VDGELENFAITLFSYSAKKPGSNEKENDAP
jgi:hypothetical protein